MSRLRPRSLQLQLALRLGVMFLVATGLAVGALLARTYIVAESMSERNLIGHADDIGQAVDAGTRGAPVLRLSPTLEALYDEPSAARLYAVRDDAGRVIAASDDAARMLVGTWAAAGDEPRFFRVESFGAEAKDYYGLDVRVATAVGSLSVTVATAGDADALLHAMLEEFLFEVAWIIPVFVAATLLVGIFAIRRGLAPLREASALVGTIEPAALSVRLPTDDLPAEVVPLVRAVNRALERLEEGFAVQRRFTANAAHELRTPLAIITGALESIEGDGDLQKLRQDVLRMNRLVDQLLRVARLDGVALDVSEDVDLCDIAASVVEYMAPLAIEQGRSVALSGFGHGVRVRGNRHAIEDALRNLVENAIAHTAPRTEVLVELGSDATIRVVDHGPGVPDEDRDRLFDRFWRGRNSLGSGAGLGLPIVKEIMKAHGGEVSVSDSVDGGATFILHFRDRALTDSRKGQLLGGSSEMRS